MLIEFYIIPLYKIPKEALLKSLFSLSWCFIRRYQAVLNLHGFLASQTELY